MSEFPGLEKWYLQKKPTLSIQDVALWQMLPPHPQRTKTPAVLRVALSNGHVRASSSVRFETAEVDGDDRLTTLAVGTDA